MDALTAWEIPFRTGGVHQADSEGQGALCQEEVPVGTFDGRLQEEVACQQPEAHRV